MINRWICKMPLALALVLHLRFIWWVSEKPVAGWCYGVVLANKLGYTGIVITHASWQSQPTVRCLNLLRIFPWIFQALDSTESCGVARVRRTASVELLYLEGAVRVPEIQTSSFEMKVDRFWVLLGDFGWYMKTIETASTPSQLIFSPAIVDFHSYKPGQLTRQPKIDGKWETWKVYVKVCGENIIELLSWKMHR